MHESDEVIERVATTLRREALALPPDFDARVMQHVRDASREIASPGLWRWMTRPRTIRVSPLAGLALAAGLAGVVALAARGDELGTTGRASGPASAIAPPSAPSQQLMKFVFVDSSASRVAIVGDFNDWDEGVSQLRRLEQGVWAITIPLAPGRYHYTFVVDGTTWVPDPAAPRLEDDFGQPNSVITVGDATT